MDPLSITASAVALIQVAGSITSSLCGFVQSLRNVDTRISGLCDELANLTGFLKAVDRTLKGCWSLDLALVEEDLWRQCDVAMEDCLATLNALGMLVSIIKDAARAGAGRFAWRGKVRAVVDLNIHGTELVAYRDKIHKSNWALQTMLHTITVSVSLRNHASQETILLELDRLKSSIDDALRASLRPTGGFSFSLGDQSDAKVARNLRNLVEAARHFHSAASSTASTIRGDSSAPPHSGMAMSLMGDLPAFKRQRVEAFIRAGRHQSPSPGSERQSPLQAQSPRRSRSPATAHSGRAMSFAATDSITIPESIRMNLDYDEDDDEDDDEEFERQFLDGLEELAKDRIKNRDYSRAIEFLKEAMKREVGPNSMNDNFRQLQIQLALCHFFQGNWQAAEPIVSRLAKSKESLDVVVCNLLHAITLGHLAQYSFESALGTCRQALQGKKRLLKSEVIGQHEYAQTLALFATICDMTGDYIRAVVFRRQLPADFDYKHPGSETKFLISHPSLLKIALGDDVPDFELERPVGLAELDGGRVGIIRQHTQALNRHGTIITSPLRTRFVHHEKYERDTSKEVVYDMPSPVSATNSGSGVDADDEASTNPSSPVSPIKRRLTRVFANKRPRQPNNAAEVIPEVAVVQTAAPMTPSSRWFRSKGGIISGLRKSKILLGKKSDESVLIPIDNGGRPSTFRLLNMEPITLEKLSDSEYDRHRQVSFNDDALQSLAENRMCSAPKVTELSSVSQSGASGASDDRRLDNFTTHNGVLYVDIARDVAAAQPGFQSLSNTIRQPSIAELPDSGVDSFKLSKDFWLGCREAEYLERHAAAYWGDPICSWQRPANDRIKTTALNTTHIGDQMQRKSPDAVKERHHLRIDTRNRENTDLQRNAPSASPLRIRTRAITDLNVLPGRLADILISLPMFTGSEECQMAKQRLEILLQDTRLLCNDTLLCWDLERAIQSLDDKEDRAEVQNDDENSDSGYETLEKDEDEPLKLHVISDPDSEEFSPAGAVPKPPRSITIDTKSITPRSPLERAFSFVVGVESECSLSRLGDLEDEDPSNSPSIKDDSIDNTPKKQVSRALDPKRADRVEKIPGQDLVKDEPDRV